MRMNQFYNGFAELLAKFKETVQGWVYGRRSELRWVKHAGASSIADEKGRSSSITQLQARQEAADRAQRSPSLPAEPEPESYMREHEPYQDQTQTYHFQPAPQLPSAPTFTLPPPDSSSWQSAEDFLPPPPTHRPSQRAETREPPTQAMAHVSLDSGVASSPRRSTRSTRQTDEGVNPFQAGASRRKGGGVV